jgi:hypothetical protein
MSLTKCWQWWVLVVMVGVVILTYLHTQDTINLLLTNQHQVQGACIAINTTLCQPLMAFRLNIPVLQGT